MRTRAVGVLTALATTAFFFAAIVLTIAAIEDYQENSGHSFVERAAGIVGIGPGVSKATGTIDFAQTTKKEDATSGSDKMDKGTKESPETFSFFRRSEGNEGWSDEFFERGRRDRDYEYKFEDRFNRSPESSPFEVLPFDRFEFEGPWGTDWIDDLVERGVMTEEDADKFKSWFDDLPQEFDEKLPDFSGDRDFEFDSDDGRFRFRWRWDSSDEDGDWFFENHPKYGKDSKNGV